MPFKLRFAKAARETLAALEAGGTSEKGQRAAQIAPRYTRETALKSYRELMSRLLDRQASGTRPN